MRKRTVIIALGAFVLAAASFGIYYARGGRLGGLLRRSPISTARGPVVIARITGGLEGNLGEDNPKGVRGWEVLEWKDDLPADVAEETRQILQDPTSFRIGGARCFEPGLAIRLSGANREDWVVCLMCHLSHVFRDGASATVGLSESGNARLLKLYNRVFPEHAVPEKP